MDTCNIGYREQRQSKHRKLKRGKRQILPKNRGWTKMLEKGN